MDDKINIEICNPKFEHEGRIGFIRALDDSRGMNINDLMSTENMIDYSGESFFKDYMNINAISNIETLDMRNVDRDILGDTNIIECNYTTFKHYHTLLGNIYDFDMYIKAIKSTDDIFEVKFIPNENIPGTVVLKDYDKLAKLPFDIAMIFIYIVIECLECKNILHFEVLPRINDIESYVLLRFLSNNAELSSKGMFEIYTEPYVISVGTKRDL